MRNRLFLISDKQIGTTLHKAVVLQSTIMCHRDITRLCLEYKMPKILIGHHCYNTKTHTLKKKKKHNPQILSLASEKTSTLYQSLFTAAICPARLGLADFFLGDINKVRKKRFHTETYRTAPSPAPLRQARGSAGARKQRRKG